MTRRNRHHGRRRPPALLLALLAVLLALPSTTAAADDDVEEEASSEAADPEDLGLDTPADPGDLGLLDDLEDISLYDDLALLAAEDVVVSAVRHAQPIEESPSAITVLTREQIRASGYTDLVELLRLVPGADVYRINQSHVAVGLRSRSTYGGDRVLALIDGRDFASAMAGFPLWMGMPIDIGSIERVEIIRGPASTLYGANALQGVINIVTRAPSDETFSAEGDVWVAGQRTHTASLRAHGTLDRLSWWASAGHDHRAPYDQPEQRDLEVYRARALASYEPSKDSELTVELGVSSLQGAIHILDVGRGTVGAFQPYLRSRLGLGRTELQLIAEYSDFTLDMDLGVNFPTEGEEQPLPIVSAPPIRQPALSVQATGSHHVELFEGNRLTAGVSMQAIHHAEGVAVRCPPGIEHQDFERDQCETYSEVEGRIGAFVQDEWRLTDALTFTGGLRLDYNSFTPEPALSPRAALVLKPARDHALRASYGRAYRKPTGLQARGRTLFDENPSAPADLRRRLVHLFAYGIGNPDLRNEKTDSYEIGWRGRLPDGGLVATLDLFHIRFYDLIWFQWRNLELEPGFGGVDTLPEDASFMFQNSGRGLSAWSWGGEAALTMQPARSLMLRGTYGLDYFQESVTDEESGETFVRRVEVEPMHRLTGSVRWRLTEELTVSLDVLWSSSYSVSIPDPESILLPRMRMALGRHVLLNGSAAYEFAGGAMEIGVAAFNAPDLDVQDMPRAESHDGHFGAERLSRRVKLFVRGVY